MIIFIDNLTVFIFGLWAFSRAFILFLAFVYTYLNYLYFTVFIVFLASLVFPAFLASLVFIDILLDDLLLALFSYAARFLLHPASSCKTLS